MSNLKEKTTRDLAYEIQTLEGSRATQMEWYSVFDEEFRKSSLNSLGKLNVAWQPHQNTLNNVGIDNQSYSMVLNSSLKQNETPETTDLEKPLFPWESQQFPLKSRLNSSELLEYKPMPIKIGVELEERLFDARANAKISFANVSMHFEPRLKKKLFSQLDSIHDSVDWEDEELPITPESLSTFLRWFYLTNPARLPNFALSNKGHLIASWIKDKNDTLIMEFMGNDHVRYFVNQVVDDEMEQGNATTLLHRVNQVLEGFQASNWWAEVNVPR